MLFNFLLREKIETILNNGWIWHFKLTLHILQNIIMSTNILPPLPPSSAEEFKFLPGDFEYLDRHMRPMIKDAYEVILRNELWRSFREALLSRGVNHSTGFMFSDDPLYIIIKTKILSTQIGCGHTGSTIGYVMREMEFIALNGEPAYKLLVMKRNNNPP